ncbi:MAG: two-component system sensor histidine kinase NtrB, partial [Caulobacteraceae bacterium]
MELPRAAKARSRADPLGLAGAMFFVLAVGFAAAPAFKAGSVALAGLILLVGLAGVAFIGLFAFRGASGPQEKVGEVAGDILGALAEPIAIVSPGGAIIETTSAWRALAGEGGRLAPGALFSALKAARTIGAAEGVLVLGDEERRVRVARLGGPNFLVRILEPSKETPTAPTAVPFALDRFASASPFGAALIEGDDPFEGRFLEVNASLATIAGPAACQGARLADLIDPVSAQEARSRFAAGHPGPFEASLAAAGERNVDLFLSRAEGGFLAFLVDVTEQKKMQLQLVQRNKMEAIGQLAGGVAHDFNNLLSAMRLRVDELLLRHSLGDPSYESLGEIKATIFRAADLVRQLLSFSRKATIQREVLEMGEFIGNLEVLLRRLVREDVGLECVYGPDLPRVRADRSQLETAVMNLVVNARDSVRANGGGKITVRIARVTEGEAAALGHQGPGAGDMALIEVADDGPGIDPKIIGNIFEPFFTTKAVGEGTGLGLATVYGIVKQSEGWIGVASNLGEGAVFRIFLPAWRAPLTLEQPQASERPRARPRDLSGVGRILFVEDEASVRGIAARLLRAR